MDFNIISEAEPAEVEIESKALGMIITRVIATKQNCIFKKSANANFAMNL